MENSSSSELRKTLAAYREIYEWYLVIKCLVGFGLGLTVVPAIGIYMVITSDGAMRTVGLGLIAYGLVIAAIPLSFYLLSKTDRWINNGMFLFMAIGCLLLSILLLWYLQHAMFEFSMSKAMFVIIPLWFVAGISILIYLYAVFSGESVFEFRSCYADRPTEYDEASLEIRNNEAFIDSKCCIVSDRYFLFGTLAIALKEQENTFRWGVWVSVSEEDFRYWMNSRKSSMTAPFRPFHGRLAVKIPGYTNTIGLPASVQIQEDEEYPCIVLDEFDHPLFLAQRDGISSERASELIEIARSNQGWNSGCFP